MLQWSRVHITILYIFPAGREIYCLLIWKCWIFFPAECQTEGNAREGTPVGLQEDWNYSWLAGITTVLESASEMRPPDVRQAGW